MARVQRRPAALLAVALAVAATILPSPAAAPARAASPVGVGQIVAGSVGRSSLHLDATYRASLKLGWVSRSIWVDSTATITNTSGAEIDRIELNTIAARLGGIRLRPVLVDGVEVGATVTARRSWSRSAASSRSTA